MLTVNEIYGFDVNDFDDDAEEDKNRYRGVAGWLLFVSIAGIISQIVLAIIQSLFYAEVIQKQYSIFRIVVRKYCDKLKPVDIVAT